MKDSTDLLPSTKYTILFGPKFCSFVVGKIESYTFVINSDACLDHVGEVVLFCFVFLFTLILTVDNSSFSWEISCSAIELKIHIVLFMTNTI